MSFCNAADTPVTKKSKAGKPKIVKIKKKDAGSSKKPLVKPPATYSQ